MILLLNGHFSGIDDLSNSYAMANGGVMEYNRPDPEGEARGIRAVIFHNPDVAMA